MEAAALPSRVAAERISVLDIAVLQSMLCAIQQEHRSLAGAIDHYERWLIAEAARMDEQLRREVRS